MAERFPRIGTTFPIAFTIDFDADTPNVITAASLYLYDSAGVAVSGSPFTATVTELTANISYRAHYNLVTSALAAGDYTGRMTYVSDNPVDDSEVEGFCLLPVTSKYDRWVSRVKRWLRDSGLTEEQSSLSYRDYMDACNTAVETYSRARPRLIEWEPVLAAGDWTYALPADWLPGVSRIIEAEYPRDVLVQSRPYLRAADLKVDEADLLLYFVNHEPSAGEAARILYLGAHTLSHTVDNLPAAHFEAIACQAAAVALTLLANGAAGTESAAIQAQGVSMRDVTQRYQAQARLLEAQARSMWRDRRWTL